MTCHAALTFGCSTCIDRVRTDQRRAEYIEWTDQALLDEWTRNPLGPDDDIIGLLLVERSVISFEELRACDVTGEAVS